MPQLQPAPTLPFPSLLPKSTEDYGVEFDVETTNFCSCS